MAFKLNVEDYCEDCANFEPASDTRQLYFNDNVYSRETDIYCAHSTFCHNIYKHIKKKMEEKK